jgi:hypothetical protein
MLLDICVLVGVEIEGEQMDQLKYRCNDLLQSSTDQINPPIKRLYNYLRKHNSIKTQL